MRGGKIVRTAFCFLCITVICAVMWQISYKWTMVSVFCIIGLFVDCVSVCFSLLYTGRANKKYPLQDAWGSARIVRVSQQCLHENGPQVLENEQWPPNNSPNLNRIEISCVGSDAWSYFETFITYFIELWQPTAGLKHIFKYHSHTKINTKCM